MRTYNMLKRTFVQSSETNPNCVYLFKDMKEMEAYVGNFRRDIPTLTEEIVGGNDAATIEEYLDKLEKENIERYRKKKEMQ